MKNWLKAASIFLFFLFFMAGSIFLGIKLVEWTEPSSKTLGSILIGFLILLYTCISIFVIKEDLDRKDRRRERERG